MRALLIIVLFVFASSGFAQTSDNKPRDNIQVRTYLDPEGDYYVGQLIKFWVEITTLTSFEQAPRYPDLKMDGAISVMPEQLGVNFSLQENGNTIIGQRQRYAIIPQRTGELLIPQLKIMVGIKGTNNVSGLNELITQPLIVKTRFPPGAENIEQLVVTTNLSIKETYSDNIENVKVGDVISRKITITADNMLAVALPTIVFEQIAGTNIYQTQPVLNDEVNRGQYSATRSDAASYVLQNPGAINFPDIKIQWWNIEKNKLEITILPEISFNVAANNELQTYNVLSDSGEGRLDKLKYWLVITLDWIRLNIAYLSLAAIGVYIFILSWRKYSQTLISRYKKYWQAITHSEWLAFFKFKLALRFQSRQQASVRFWHWLDQITPSNQVASLSALAKKVNDENIIAFIEQFETNKYSNYPKLQKTASDIDYHVGAFRKRLLAKSNTKDHVGEIRLNP